jgi:NAD(P)-dependent dehydrogenase (short-subunit alcohol dehydrogenase family)
VFSFTRSLATEVGQYGITVSAHWITGQMLTADGGHTRH